MGDLLFVAVAVAFFALAAAYVTVCDRLIGREGTASAADGDESADEAVPVAR